MADEMAEAKEIGIRQSPLPCRYCIAVPMSSSINLATCCSVTFRPLPPFSPLPPPSAALPSPLSLVPFPLPCNKDLNLAMHKIRKLMGSLSLKIIKILYGHFVEIRLVDLIAAGTCPGVMDSPKWASSFDSVMPDQYLVITFQACFSFLALVLSNKDSYTTFFDVLATNA